MPIDHAKLEAALRDSAAKALEVTEIEVPDFEAEMLNPRFKPLTRKEVRETYSKEWIAGRLLGMADTIEALISGDTDDRT